MAHTHSHYQEDIFEFMASGHGHGQVIAPAGSGKCLGIDTPVMLYDGSIKPVQAIQVGDLLMGDDSTPRRVLSTSRGYGDLFRITPVKGDSWVCNAEHMMTVVGTNHHKGKVIDVPLEQLILSRHPDRNWKLLRSAPVHFLAEDLRQSPFPPYLIGLWLGDGTCATATITTPEPEIIAYLETFAQEQGYRLVNHPNDCTKADDRTRQIGLRKGGATDFTPNPLRSYLLDVCTKNGEKTIPMDLLTSSIEVRKELLAGLLDTDGYYSRSGYEITTRYLFLSDQILFLARSLGLAAYCHPKEVRLPEWSSPRTYYRIVIQGALDSIPCRVPRKQAKPRRQIKRTNVTGWTASYIGPGDYYGFTLTGNGRFLLGDFTVTHNTYTGVQAVQRIPRGMSAPAIVFLAFNKHIQVELSQKLPDYALAKTYHSFGLSALPGGTRKFQIDGYKNNMLLKAHFPEYGMRPIFPTIDKITGLFKGNLIPEVTPQTVNQIVDQYAIELSDEDDSYWDEIVEGTRYLLNPEHCERLGKVDFDDMIWYPLARNLPIPPVDYLLVDEYQDTNAAQEELVFRAKNSHGRVLAIGDPNQAIYGWRGAGTQSMENFARRMNATQLPLSITYRCPLSVVRLVNELFPHIPFEAAPGAIEGSVNHLSEEQMFKQLQPGHMVLCRLNAPLVAPAMRLLRMGVKAVIKGRDIGKNLLQMIQKVERLYYPENLNQFLGDLDDYVQKESAKLRMVERMTQATLLEDKAETILAFADGASTVADVKNNIDRVFDDNNEGVVFSTGHKAKGLEAEHVYLIRPELFPFKRAKSEEAKKQEVNLQYVAYTRPKVSLNFVV